MTDRRPGYWARLILDIRRAAQLSQTQLSDCLGTDQGTISRWERGLAIPQHESRKQIDELARKLCLATLHDLSSVVHYSPFPMILVDRDMMVIAASEKSGFSVGISCLDQTEEQERPCLQQFGEALDTAGFWDQLCPKFDYEFRLGQEVRRAVVIAVPLRGDVFALVQKA